MSPGDAWKPLAKCCGRNHNGKDTLAESAQLALEDEEFEDMIPIYAAAVISDSHKDAIDPKSYKSATEFPLGDKWDTAMKQEFDAIGQHQVFGDFVWLPEERKTLPSHCVYKIMHNGAGNVQRFKARPVCGGNHQIEVIDCQAMYAPTAPFGYVSMALVIAAKYDLMIYQMDIWTAVLWVNLEEEIYMHPPQGYCRLLQNGCWFNDPTLTKTLWKMVLCLRKSLYGLKQSSHIW